MPLERTEPGKPLLPFGVWKMQLRKDCEAQDKLLAFNALGDSVLVTLWQSGIAPNVKAIADGAPERQKNRGWS